MLPFRHEKQTSKNVTYTNFKIYLRSTSKAMVDREGGETEIQKSEYLENEKSVLDEIKNFFHSF